MNRKLIIGGGAILVTAIAAGIALWLSISQDGRFRPLMEAERYEVFSLDPPPVLSPPTTAPGNFHGYISLGSTVITDAKTREALNAALIEGVKYAPQPAECFTPRHAIRVTHNGNVIDLLICFECRQIQVLRGPKTTEAWGVSDSPQPLFDKVLTDAGVKLAAKSK